MMMFLKTRLMTISKTKMDFKRLSFEMFFYFQLILFLLLFELLPIQDSSAVLLKVSFATSFIIFLPAFQTFTFI